MQQSLFSNGDLMSLPLADAKVQYLANWLDNKTATTLFDMFVNELDWSEGEIKLFGKMLKIPRLQAWYGDPDAHYQYSGTAMTPLPWNKDLLILKQKCERLSGTIFNSVLANLYRDGVDSMGMHSDDEPELGQQPTITSVSLGATRNFDFKNKVTGEKFRLPLEHGSILIMSGETQRYWQHGIAKTKKAIMPRINFTFRNVKALT
ncbi:MAG: alkylated DNA repair dioxygenase AlkB [Granulosicoccus sp.]|jgi:alkylated DNA repair dioxygenase AlkB